MVAPDVDNIFLRRKVTVGESNDDNTRAHIVQGLLPGDIILSEGGLYLNN